MDMLGGGANQQASQNDGGFGDFQANNTAGGFGDFQASNTAAQPVNVQSGTNPQNMTQ